MCKSTRSARAAETLLRRGRELARRLRLREWMGDIQAGDGERCKRFIHSANHDTGFVAPCRLCAALSEERTYVPGQEGKPNGPKGGVDGIDWDIDFRREGAQVMEDSRRK